MDERRDAIRQLILELAGVQGAPSGRVADALVALDGLARDLAEAEPYRQRAAGLAHAQRLEAIGRQSRGVAHHFNNLLSVVVSYASLLHDELNPSDPMRDDLN